MVERPLIMTGFMGSGKSTVGKIVAERLGYRFIDLDAEIVAAAGCSVNDIFANKGEPEFRALESSTLEQILSAEERCVVATGGGAVICQQNRTLMRRRGVIINLMVTLEQMLVRLSGCSDRPLLAGDDAAKRAETLMNEREQFYADADIRIDTDGKSVEDVAAEILCRLKGLLSEYPVCKSC
ncbi:MAG: shikimate kinase [Geobacteraceae bacterium]|nr:shikimate kinase [Geobacteraceae bacterium]NTW79469.1 shikimate kinase [Geobacteraceae bacterium]